MSTPITVVLVHGAFAESASWSGVIPRLTDAGIPVIATPNPLRSVATDAENVRRTVAGVEGPVLLVGHSYGGAVITEAAVENPDVVGLVYVAAFAPDHGENALELTAKFPGSTLGETVRAYPLGDGTNDLYVDRALFPNQFAADVAPDEAAVQARTQRPIRDAALGEPQPAATPAWKTLPSWFVFGDADKNIPVEGLRFMAQRAGGLTVTEVPGASHSVMVSQPDAVVAVITEALAHLAR
ncbi:alpha/beta fold hydrolase [Microbacterium thalli]|uniref:alpha/beta fold hydrolase n=1 Tax=Microbacterium thalli TaxID=3027921 RepID=UPI00236530AD|nr:alpha/beta hydrolase [Microbacterium thalli]MDD7930697.1 alpha/beta hydrolase [Microbacterium thalli]